MDRPKKKFFDELCITFSSRTTDFIAAETAWQLKRIADALEDIADAGAFQTDVEGQINGGKQDDGKRAELEQQKKKRTTS